MKTLLASILLITTFACAHKSTDSFLAKTQTAQSEAKSVRLQSGAMTYSVVSHSEKFRPLMRGNYSAAELGTLESALQPSLEISLTPRGLAQAADRELAGEKDSTNYDAIWLRDTMWVYLGLRSAKHPQAQTVLIRMLDYLASDAQLRRMDRLISSPQLLKTPKANMEVIHIRFNGASTDFEDVLVGGNPQDWNHKQNDALGLFYDLTWRALAAKEIPTTALTRAHWRVLTGLPCYFDQIRFWEMEEAGPWEEIDRVNTSSIALVTSGLENLGEILKTNSALASEIGAQAKPWHQERCVNRDLLARLTDRGYERIRRQLAAGGESPLYPLSSPKYRRADAALFNAIYPARLKRLTLDDKLTILQINQPLIGRVGIKRYLFDSYQSGNFWLKPSTGSSEAVSHTDDTSSDESFADRGQQFIPDTEAQWFFDSWVSVIYGQLYKEKRDEILRERQLYHFNRALAQLTGGTSKSKWLGADGKPVPALVPPESYNQLVSGDTHLFVASPITPLNWAKAGLRLALEELKNSVR